MKDLAALTLEEFEPAIGETFAIVFSDAELDLVLERVEALGHDADRPRDPFSLVFLGPTEPELIQHTYAVRHRGSLGELLMFLVPISAAEDGTRYQAIFA